MRQAIGALLLILAQGAPGAQAGAPDDLEARMAAQVEECLAVGGAGPGAPECVGAAADLCWQASGDDEATIRACFAAETALWDARLNSDYKARRAALEAMGLGADLLTAQRAWLAFRDAECGLRRAVAGGGTLSSLSAAICMMERTAARVFDLRALAAEIDPEAGQTPQDGEGGL